MTVQPWWRRARETGSADVVVEAHDARLTGLVARSLADLAALRMATAVRPDDEFYAAGSPWYFTLFGRDSIWAARMTLPLGLSVARGTLRTLAHWQGRQCDADTAEEPGKIMHELRRPHSSLPDPFLPPTYYGTVDATPLWICLLFDAWRWGLPAGRGGRFRSGARGSAELDVGIRRLRWGRLPRVRRRLRTRARQPGLEGFGRLDQVRRWADRRGSGGAGRSAGLRL